MTIYGTVPNSLLSRPLSRRSMLAYASGAAMMPTLAPGILAATHGTPAATSTFDSLDALLASVVEQGVPGIALKVERGGETVFSGAAGVASVEDGTALRASDRFRIYSITKAFTATVVLQLVDEGLLSLDDTVAQVLDDPAAGRIPNIDIITIRQLLNHTSGIYDYLDEADSPFYEDAFFAPDADWARVWTLPELLAYADAARHEPYFPPGESAHYSNTGYLLLGMIVEQATGNVYQEELRARVLTPLGLTDTSLEMGAALPDDVVDAYHVLDGELVNVTTINLTWSWTGGAMVSTTADLVRFADAVFSGELLSPESHDEMFTFTPDPQYAEFGFEWGLGIYRVSTPNGELSGMEGGAAGGSSYMMRHPDGDVTVAVLANWAPDDDRRVSSVRDEAITWALAQASPTPS